MPAQVIVVAGPSGAGKSVLCRRLCAERGLTWVILDDFYKDGDDPTLPVAHLRGGAPIVDWDDPRSWHRDLAVQALVELCREGVVAVPVYDIASDGRVGERTVRLGAAAYVLAEGIFADHVVGPCRDQGLLAAAVCVRNPPLLTFWRRLTRDLRESRKPPWVLLRRGFSLLRADPVVVARAEAAGCTVMTSREAYVRLLDLTGD